MAGRIAYYGNIATQGLVLDLDAAIQGSYPKTGSTWFDISNNGNNGTLTNGPLYTGSDYGAIRFDGTNDYVDCGTANIIPNSWTLGGWVNQRRTTGTGMIIARSAGVPLYEQNATLGWSSTRSSSYYVAGKLTNGTYYYECTSSVFLNTGSILNIVGTFNEPTTTLTLYINGAPVNTKNPGFPMTLTGSQRIQVGCSDGSTLANFFSGSIYQTQIYNQSLSQFQVWQNFNAYKSRYGIPDIVTDGLVLNLDAGNPYSYLSGSSGTTWSNTVAVSSSISGTLVNGTTYSNGAMVFDGVDDYAIISNSSTSLTFSNLEFSVFCWVYVISFNQFSTFIGKCDATAIRKEWSLQVSRQSTFIPSFIATDNTSTWTIELNAPNTLNSNQWYNIGISRIGNRFDLYINGTSVANTTNSLTILPNSLDVEIARLINDSTYDFSGRISNILIYKNKGLSASEVQQNFNALRGRYGI